MQNATFKQQFLDKGYFTVPKVIDAAGLDILRKAADDCMNDTTDPGRVTEVDGKTVRGLHGAHLRNEALATLCRHPTLLGAAKFVLGEDVYVHQFKLNIKAAFVGDVWEWHQDMTFYHREDELPEPQFLTVAVFLDDVTEFNAPLTVIPGSHVDGFKESIKHTIDTYDKQSDWLSNTTAKLRYTVDRNVLREMVRLHGMDAPKGKAGDIVVFHANLFHASGVNISPFDRRVAFISYNSVKNLPVQTRPPRPEFLAARDYSPLTPRELGDLSPNRDCPEDGRVRAEVAS
ncbi:MULTISPECIES: phytanoyl-CoA dioxygenase family protein [Burkholderia]|uniref:Phytanoyl-CoA dioxygenase family protein n=1 Tax=Burkholderia anthina TaxID=179879 RepID=A0A7T6VLY8_9BURK|nr:MULTISPECIES: phytanoyl-CoA dioxygenase family protein [Burkholderia]MBY4868927.1 phytanoyl-CoA dioxygenase family protein [Burkholderia anthina]QQK06191.1 phytanoyl-CoA dioxygenase family protein [Burkholderia anthina]